MRLKFFFLFTFFTLLFLFYPGNTYYFEIFAYNREYLAQKEDALNLKKNPIPIVTSSIEPEISAEGAYIVDLPSFTPIFERNTKSRLYPASITKMITALVAYDLYKPDQILIINKVLEEGQVMDLRQGEKITVENLLYGILVHSANDAAYALADSYGFSKFVDLMNKKASSLKMQNTFFKNSTGFDDVNQYSTAFDLAIAAREILKNKYLSKIASTKEIIISDTDFKTFHKLSNVNKLLGELQGVGGLKTGYTDLAGENLITFYKKEGHEFLIIILKSQDRFEDTKNIIKWIEENVSYINYSPKYSSVTAGT